MKIDVIYSQNKTQEYKSMKKFLKISKWLLIMIIPLLALLLVLQTVSDKYRITSTESVSTSYADTMVASLKILSLNAWDIPIASYNRDKRLDDLIIHVIDYNYDIVLLQEMFIPKDIETLIEQLGYSYNIIYPKNTGIPFVNWITSGLVILSKYPFINHESYTWKERKGIEVAAKKGALQTTIRVGQTELVFFNVHLQADTKSTNHQSVREMQMQQLAGYISALDHEFFILAGDFNSDKLYEMTGVVDINACFHLPCSINIEGNVYSNRFAGHSTAALVDYIFVGKNIFLKKVEMIDNQFFSDHAAVWAEIMIK